MKSIRICILLFLFGLILTLISCGKPNLGPAGTGGNGVVSFSAATATYDENAGTISIPVSISAAPDSDIVVTYNWGSSDTTTFLGGDFTFDPTELVISAGQTSGVLSVEVIDDTQIDGTDDITVTLVSAKGATISPTAFTYDVIINDNDKTPIGEVQMDLTWYLTDSIRLDVNGATLRLFLQYGVKVSGNTVTDQGKTYDSTTNTNGFTTLYLNQNAPDSVYYIVAAYRAGKVPASFLLSVNGLGNTGISGGDYSFDKLPADIGANVYTGPFTKSGVTFPFTGGRSLVPANPDGKIHTYRVDKFKPRQ